jgi:hypothetical protein
VVLSMKSGYTGNAEGLRDHYDGARRAATEPLPVLDMNHGLCAPVPLRPDVWGIESFACSI